MHRDTKVLETACFSDEFKELLQATPESESAPVRRNMALGAWLAQQKVHGQTPDKRTSISAKYER